MMRQRLGEYEDYADSPELMGEERADEYYRPQRRWPASLLTIGAMIVFAGGLWFAYVQGTRHPAATGIGSSSGEGVPLIRADNSPTKVKPDQPGGMAVPDQNVSLYNEKPGGPPVEKLLSGPEQPMPRPTAPAKEAAAAPPPPIPAPSAAPPQAAPEPAAPASPAPAKPAAQAKPAPTAKETAGAKEAAAILGSAPSASPKAGGAVRVQLGALRSPEAARDEWARLKREQPELLGKLTAIAVRADLGDKGIFYRIQAGPLTDAAAGERLCGELRQRKLGCALVR
jgi:hypothetical protein